MSRTPLPAERPRSERVVVVTGAARGLGRSIAREVAGHCAAALLVDFDEQGLRETAEQLAVYDVATLVADLTEPESAELVIAHAYETLGGADVLVNNARLVDYAGFFETSRVLFRRLLAVDVESLYFLTQAFASRLRDFGRGGSVVNIGTSHALVGVGRTSAYSAAKGAVHALTRSLAVELAPLGIRVNTLALGTAMTERVRAELSPDLLEQRMQQIPLGRGAEPGEAAAAVAFLLDAGFATGSEVVLDGGFTVFGDH